MRHFEISQNGDDTKLKLAKIDIGQSEMREFLDYSLVAEINSKLKALGYNFVTFDMGGLKSGSLNIKMKQ